MPSAESSHIRWDRGNGRIPRQPYHYKILLKYCKEAGHKWRVSTTAPGPPFT